MSLSHKPSRLEGHYKHENLKFNQYNKAILIKQENLQGFIIDDHNFNSISYGDSRLRENSERR